MHQQSFLNSSNQKVGVVVINGGQQQDIPQSMGTKTQDQKKKMKQKLYQEYQKQKALNRSRQETSYLSARSKQSNGLDSSLSSSRQIPPVESSVRSRPPLPQSARNKDRSGKKNVPQDNSFLFMDQSSINMNQSYNKSQILNQSLFDKSANIHKDMSMQKQDVEVFDDAPDENAGLFKYPRKHKKNAKSPTAATESRQSKKRSGKSHQPFKELPPSKQLVRKEEEQDQSMQFPSIHSPIYKKGEKINFNDSMVQTEQGRKQPKYLNDVGLDDSPKTKVTPPQRKAKVGGSVQRPLTAFEKLALKSKNDANDSQADFQPQETERSFVSTGSKIPLAQALRERRLGNSNSSILSNGRSKGAYAKDAAKRRLEELRKKKREESVASAQAAKKPPSTARGGGHSRMESRCSDDDNTSRGLTSRGMTNRTAPTRYEKERRNQSILQQKIDQQKKNKKTTNKKVYQGNMPLFSGVDPNELNNAEIAKEAKKVKFEKPIEDIEESMDKGKKKEKERKSRWEEAKLKQKEEQERQKRCDEAAKKKKEEEEKNPVADWFANVFTFGCAGSGCCAGEKSSSINRAEEMEWNGISTIENKQKLKLKGFNPIAQRRAASSDSSSKSRSNSSGSSSSGSGSDKQERKSGSKSHTRGGESRQKGASAKKKPPSKNVSKNQSKQSKRKASPSPSDSSSSRSSSSESGSSSGRSSSPKKGKQSATGKSKGYVRGQDLQSSSDSDSFRQIQSKAKGSKVSDSRNYLPKTKKAGKKKKVSIVTHGSSD